MPIPRKTPARRSAARKTAPVKRAAQAASKPRVAPARKTDAKAAAKPKKVKLVRDSYTIPKVEYLVLDDLKQRALKAGAPSKKSELLRAGVKALAAMGDAAFLAAMQAVPPLKTGRPPKT